MAPRDPRYQAALARFEEVHRADPKMVISKDGRLPFSLHYHRRLAHWVSHLARQPSDELLLAAHCQHIRRWAIPRSRYPADRAGYKRWRKKLAQFHSQEAGRILDEVGYPEASIERVGQLLQKIRLKLDPEVQLFEDAICLVFLENELADFSTKHDQSKLKEILRKTWRKMSPHGQAAAQKLVGNLPPALQKLVQQALSA